MAVPSPALIEALRQTAARLQRPEVTYRWSHAAHCNCGHLAQTLTRRSPRFIRDSARQHAGDWAQQAQAQAASAALDQQAVRQQALAHQALPDGTRCEAAPSPYLDLGRLPAELPAPDEGAWEPEDLGACNVTGHSMSQIFAEMVAHGLTHQDIANLERLEDAGVRRRMGNSTIDIAHGEREVVIEYLLTWATILEEQLQQEQRQEEALHPVLPLAEAAE